MSRPQSDLPHPMSDPVGQRPQGFDLASGKTARIGAVRNLVQIGALVLVVLISLPMVVQIWGQVSAKLLQLRSSEKDNVIWNLTQLEVEFLKLERSLIAATTVIPDPTSEHLEDVRRNFDVYYSRLSTLDSGVFYRNAFQIAGTQTALHLIRTEVASMAQVIDLPDAQLLESLPQLLTMHQNRSRLVRRIISRGNQYTGQRGQDARDEVSTLLLRLSIASVVSFLALALATVLLYRNSRWYQANAIEYRNASARFAALIATSPDAVVVTDAQGFIVEFNQAAEALFSRSRENMLGRRLAKYLFDATGSWARLPLIGAEPHSALQLAVRCIQGGTVPIELSQGVAQVGGGSFYVYFLRDISDRLAADQDVRASRDRALAGERAKSRFLAVMSHEMRTPLNGILGLIEVMEGGDLSKEDRERYFELMRQSGQILLDHVNDVLDAAKLEAEGLSLHPEPFDLDQMLADLVGPMVVAAAQQGNTLKFDAQQAPFGRFYGDSNRLRQILLNLLSNAIKFTYEGDVCMVASLGPVSTSSKTPNMADLEFQITDTGIGISEQDQSRIFDDFVRLDRDDTHLIEGTGLGLGIAKRLVEEMGGEIGVESLEGEGSLFWVRVTLPWLSDEQDSTGVVVPRLAQKTEENGDKQCGAPSEVVSPQKILVVEDNATNRLVVRELLERDGHEVVEEVNGKLGLARAQNERFDVIFMDLNMPVMGGLEASRQIRQSGLCRDSRIVALTAHVTDRADVRCQSAGMDAVLSKPLRRIDLRRVLQAESGLLSDRDGEDTRQSSSDLLRVADMGDLDQAHLNQVLAALSTVKKHKLLRGVQAEGSAMMQQIEAAVAASEVGALSGPLSAGALTGELRMSLSQAAHAMAGSAAVIGARRLRNALLAFEDDLEDPHMVDVLFWKKELTAIWCDTLQALKDAGMEELKEEYENGFSKAEK